MSDEAITIEAAPPRGTLVQWWGWMLIGAAGLLVVQGVITGAVLTIGSLSGGLTVSGTLAMTNAATDPCSPGGGYSDIHPGAQVTVTDPAGKTLGVGQLDDGNDYGGGCIFSFSVGGVPAGAKFYGIEVAHRGIVQFTEEAVRQGSEGVGLSLGD